jgi:hypothetical protein
MQLATRACVWCAVLGWVVWYGGRSGAAGVDVVTMNGAAVPDAATSSPPQVCVVQIMASGAVLSAFANHPTDPTLAILVPTDTATNVPVSCQDLTSLGLAVANQEASPVRVQIRVFTHQGTPLCTRGPFTLSEHGARGVVFGSDCVEATMVVGMVADDATHAVTVFNADTDTVLGTVPLPHGGNDSAIGDCSITADQRRGVVTNFNFQVSVIDLTTSPPSLAPQPNPIRISNYGEDTAISPDGRFLVVCDGSVTQPISVVDIATQTQMNTFALGHDCNSVDVCSDGSVLVTSVKTGKLRRLTIDAAGTLLDTGEALSSGEPNNVFCAPGGTSGIVITREAAQIQSFTIPGLEAVNTRPLSGEFGISGLIHPGGDQVFARSNERVDIFDYQSTTGVLSAAPRLTIRIAGTPTFYGMDQMALHPNGTKLYVSQPGALQVYHANTGARLTSITASGIVGPTGVCFAPHGAKVSQ